MNEKDENQTDKWVSFLLAMRLWEWTGNDMQYDVYWLWESRVVRSKGDEGHSQNAKSEIQQRRFRQI